MAGKRFSTMWRLVILLLVVWAALTVRLNASWFGRDGNGAWVSAAVRNYYRYGAGELGLMVVTNPGLVGPGAYHYYVHHPPLLVWSVAAATVPFGFNAAAERWVPIAATTISVAVFYALVRRLYQDEERAWWAAALYALTPMLLIFGRIPSHEALALMLIMLYLLALTHWLARPTRARWLAVLALAVIGMWTSWATILHVGVLTLYGLWQARGRHRIAIFAVGVIALGAFGLMLVYYQSQWDGAIDELLRAFVWRSSTATLHTDSVTFTLGQYIGQVFTHLLWMLTPTVLVLGVAGIVPAFRRDP
ncbi:MAG: glycosyltransferase family 39 protein, partial [Anaerolineae bacterium]|nr:glycosyltransferase family 39 protein [Anaerolineae bacterium]